MPERNGKRDAGATRGDSTGEFVVDEALASGSSPPNLPLRSAAIRRAEVASLLWFTDRWRWRSSGSAPSTIAAASADGLGAEIEARDGRL